jgi:hypothetical protein
MDRPVRQDEGSPGAAGAEARRAKLERHLAKILLRDDALTLLKVNAMVVASEDAPQKLFLTFPLRHLSIVASLPGSLKPQNNCVNVS